VAAPAAIIAGLRGPLAGAKRVQLTFVCGAPQTTVLGDAGRLQQIVANLLTNAIKFTPEHGAVRLELRHDGEFSEIQVADTGTGIPARALPFIFDRFWQADDSRSRSGGVGLGLSIAKYLVTAHGGTIDATSAGAGKGSTFTVRLPLTNVPETVDVFLMKSGADDRT